MDADAHDVDSNERPTPEPFDALVSEVRGVLGDDVVGLYVYGSAVMGGFDAEVSDIEFIAVTSEIPNGATGSHPNASLVGHK